MAQATPRLCFEQILPRHLAKKATEKAITENPANASPFEAAAAKSKLWKPGRTLRVRFLNGETGVQEKVQSVAQQWSAFANITRLGRLFAFPRA